MKKQFSYYIEESDKQLIDKVAFALEISKTDFVQYLLVEFLKRNNITQDTTVEEIQQMDIKY